MKSLNVEDAIKTGANLVALFSPPEPQQTVLDNKFYSENMKSLVEDTNYIISAWGYTYESRYSDVTHVIVSVTEAAAATLNLWGHAIINSLFEGSHRGEHVDIRLPKLGTARLHACARSLQFTRELLMDDYGYLSLCRRKLSETKWGNRPQGKLWAAIASQYLEFIALHVHASSSIAVFDDRSPYWKYVNSDNSTLILRNNNDMQRNQHCMGFVGYAAEEYRFLSKCADIMRAVVDAPATDDDNY